MAQPNFRVIDNDREHARDLARREVKRFRLDRERERLPVSNQSTGARNLFVDEVLGRTERVMPEEIKEPYRPDYFLLRLLILGLVLGLIWLAINVFSI